MSVDHPLDQSPDPAAAVRFFAAAGAGVVTVGAFIGWIILGMKVSTTSYWEANVCAVPSCELGPVHGDAMAGYIVLLGIGLVGGIIIMMLQRRRLTRLAIVLQLIVAVLMIANSVLAPFHVPSNMG